MSVGIRLLIAALLLGGCAFDPSGTLGGGGDAAVGPGVDAMREQPGDDGGNETGDGGVEADAGESTPIDAAPPVDAAPPDAMREEDDCGGFGEACCEDGDPCGGILLCVGGSCI